jgi:glutamine amidotransferase
MAIANNKIAVVDYEMGNLFSVQRACEHVGLRPVVTSNAATIMKSDALILPGVGAFGDAMDNLSRLDMIAPIKDFIAGGKPFMGICLGLQLLMTESEEFGRHKGLDIIKGTVLKFQTAGQGQRTIKVPQVGWNRIYHSGVSGDTAWESSPLKGIADNEFMYFVHSFYTVPDDARVVLSRTNYEGTEYSSSILKDNVFACQFHPEKSSSEGIKVYHNFASLVKQGKESHG